MAEPSWHHDDPDARFGDESVQTAEQRARLAEEQCLQAEGRCFAAERRRLEAERRLEQVQRLLAQARESGVRMQAIVGALAELARHLRDSLDPTDRQSTPHSGQAAESPLGDRRDLRSAGQQAEAAERAEMADALAAAVERLRARVAAVDEVGPEQPVPAAQAAPTTVASPLAIRPSHKHSLSALARLRNRWRNRRKQRRAT